MGRRARGGGQAGTRTQDQMVKSRLLYQLSYLSIRFAAGLALRELIPYT